MGSETFLQHFCAKRGPFFIGEVRSPFPFSFLFFLSQHTAPPHWLHAAEKIASMLFEMGLDSGLRVNFPGFPSAISQHIDGGRWENIMTTEWVKKRENKSSERLGAIPRKKRRRSNGKRRKKSYFFKISHHHLVWAFWGKEFDHMTFTLKHSRGIVSRTAAAESETTWRPVFGIWQILFPH